MQKIISALKPMTPAEVYLQRVGSSFDKIRKESSGIDYTPPQFGGVFGQSKAANSDVVLEILTFELT